ncbi:glycosyltransferase family 1 protein [Variovorax humicola]|uniref:Glycosyltransferase family 1 protein n=1 Tax=Variovorax humicola TaxID=1769758 RepID=A0ABU8WA37_9BURK
MKVLLIGNLHLDEQTSMLLFQTVIQREVARLGHDVRLLTPTPLLRRLPWPHRLPRKWAGYFDKFVLFPLTLKRHLRWADVVHITDHSNAMYVPRVVEKPNIVTCHDVIAIQASLGMIPGWTMSWTGRLFQRLISRGLGRADEIACVSHLTRRHLLALRLAEQQRVDVVLNGLNAAFAPVAPEVAASAVQRAGLGPQERYLMHIGLDLPRKNRITVLKTFIELQRRSVANGHAPLVDKLLIVGVPLSPPLAEVALAGGVSDKVVAIQNVSHEDLCALYTRATALLFPSLQEGFGWPIIEAQACGCPVFTSDLAPMNEIGGTAAVYVDPEDADGLATAIEEAAPRLDEMRRLGLENAASFSSERMAQGYVDTYRKAIDARQTS